MLCWNELQIYIEQHWYLSATCWTFNRDTINSIVSEICLDLVRISREKIKCEKEFLPPANEVWGKVIFSEASVILSRGGGFCMMSLPVWLPGPMFSLGVLCPWSHVPFGGSLFGGLCLEKSLFRGCLSRGCFCRETPLPPNQKSRRYASYWNAFLFVVVLQTKRT